MSRLVEALAAGTGPVAFDAERASGYRYSQRAYLIQLRREGAGTALIDPIALPALSSVNSVLQDCEWLLHAASQDLLCMAEVGLHPPRLFDTELAGRLLGEERVALGTMVEQHLGVRLEKGHSAADWSTRPLPHDWLVYAALDVELLADLRNVLAEALQAAGKQEWARQEFEAVMARAPAEPHRAPTRGGAPQGSMRLRNRRQLAAVRSLWEARDDLRRTSRRGTRAGYSRTRRSSKPQRPCRRRKPGCWRSTSFNGPRQRRQAERWFAAIEAALALPEDRPAAEHRQRWRRHPAAGALA